MCQGFVRLTAGQGPPFLRTCIKNDLVAGQRTKCHKDQKSINNKWINMCRKKGFHLRWEALVYRLRKIWRFHHTSWAATLEDKHAELTAVAFFISSSSIRAQAAFPNTFLTGARGEYFWLQAPRTLFIYLTIWHSASARIAWCAGSERRGSWCLWELKSGSLESQQSTHPACSLKQSQRTLKLTWLRHLVKRERGRQLV